VRPIGRWSSSLRNETGEGRGLTYPLPSLKSLKMRKADIISAVILFVGGLLTIFIIIPLQTTPGEKYGLPPAFLPIFSMSAVTVLSAFLLVKNLFKVEKKRGPGEPVPLSSRNWLHIVFGSDLLFLSIGAIKYMRFILGSIVIVASFMIYMKAKNPISILLTSISTSILTYFILWKIFHISLP